MTTDLKTALAEYENLMKQRLYVGYESIGDFRTAVELLEDARCALDKFWSGEYCPGTEEAASVIVKLEAHGIKGDAQ